MLKELEKLAELASSLDDRGLSEDANVLDSVIKSLADNTHPEKHSVTVKHEIKVPEAVFNQYMFPDEIPSSKHEGVKTIITVHEMDGYNAKKELEKKEIMSKNLDEARQKAEPYKKEWGALYPSSTVDEELYFL